jgi:hypothetical protein
MLLAVPATRTLQALLVLVTVSRPCLLSYNNKKGEREKIETASLKIHKQSFHQRYCIMQSCSKNFRKQKVMYAI